MRESADGLVRTLTRLHADKGLAIEPGKTVKLAPGGYHLMLMDLGVQAPVTLRINPDVDARTHPYISTGLERNKFGVPIAINGNAAEFQANVGSNAFIADPQHMNHQAASGAPAARTAWS